MTRDITQDSVRLGDAIGTIDHVVIAVADLAQSADIYRRLGFTLSPKGIHSAALGTANHTIMLREDYFELLAVVAPTERNTHWRQVITEGGGLAGMAMTTREPHAARDHWLAAGLAPETPIKFSRTVARPDGSTLEARFEVVSLDDITGTGLRLFVCSQPTRRPSMCRARARLVATVDLPTPPLPLATATTCLTPGRVIFGGPCGCMVALRYFQCETLP